MKVIWQSDPVKILVIERDARLTEIFLFFFSKKSNHSIMIAFFRNSDNYIHKLDTVSIG